MTNTMIALAALAVAMTAVVGARAYRNLAVARHRRRAAWELDRVEWRRWMTRP